jgi:hypothetical protein
LFLKRERIKKDDEDKTIIMDIFEEQVRKILDIF